MLFRLHDRFEHVLGIGRGGSGTVDARDEGTPPRNLGPQPATLLAMLREAGPPTVTGISRLFSTPQALLTDHRLAHNIACATGRLEAYLWARDTARVRTGYLDHTCRRA